MIEPKDYELPKAERRPEYDGSACMVGFIIAWILGLLTGIVVTLWIVTLP